MLKFFPMYICQACTVLLQLKHNFKQLYGIVKKIYNQEKYILEAYQALIQLSYKDCVASFVSIPMKGKKYCISVYLKVIII